MALDANSNIRDPRNGESKGEPIYPQGPPLKVPAESVQLTFLDLETGPVPAVEPSAEGETHPGLEIKTALGIRLPVFEGPLDLLLYLIRRDELDIYDIPIAHITEQYLEMVGLMKVLDLEMAGEFLVMAATLMRLKARMLLPTWPDEEEDEDDPRMELMRQLLEYRRFKEAAHQLKEKEEERRLLYGRGFIPEFESDVPLELQPMSHFALIEVMKDVLSRVGEEFFYEVELEDVTLDEKIALVLAELQEKGRALFVDLVTRFPRRLHVVVSFMAILELARLGRIAVAQETPFGQIWIYPVVDGRVVTRDAEDGAPLPAEGAGRGAIDEEPETPEPEPGRTPMKLHELTPLIEAILFVADQPLTVNTLVKSVGDKTVTAAEVKQVLDSLTDNYDAQPRGFKLIKLGSGYQIVSRKRFSPWVEGFLAGRRKTRLSRAALETAAVVAYRQPITRLEIERIRGVDAGAVLNTLLERSLILIKGRDPGPGRPLLYGTTQGFLEYFGLSKLSDLPQLDEIVALARTEEQPFWDERERARFERHGVEPDAIPTPGEEIPAEDEIDTGGADADADREEFRDVVSALSGGAGETEAEGPTPESDPEDPSEEAEAGESREEGLHPGR